MIIKFTALRSKTYSIRDANNNEKSTSNPANIRLGKDVLKMSSRRLQDVFSVTFFCLPWRLEDEKCYPEDIFKTSRRRLGKQEIFAGKGHNAFIEFQEFYDTLFKKKILRHTMRGIKYNLGTYETNKKSLSCFDDKQYILKNGINTLAHGHKDI